MRKLVLGLLLAGTAFTPAIAQRADRPGRPDHSGRAQSHEERRQERTEAREERAQSQQQARAQRVERAQQVQQAQNGGGAFVHQRRDNRGVVQAPAQVQAQRLQLRERIRQQQANVNDRGRPVLRQDGGRRDGMANWRGRNPQDVAQQQQQQHNGASSWRRLRVPQGARPDRPAPPPATASNGTTRVSRHGLHWRTDWRGDHRYDWRDHRRNHRSHFQLGFYFDPFGWGYNRYNVGWRLWPSYYSSNYWLNDPWSYRLPQAPWPLRWVRYYDDAMLVDTTTGQVVDVIYDFFW